jgi:hypothetical protein
VPIPVVESVLHAPVVSPAVVRIGPDRTLLDPPWEMVGCAVAHVWPDGNLAGGWARVMWPVDASSRRPIAPLDLHLGHVLELCTQQHGRRMARYAIVADVDEQRMVLVPAASAVDAASIARRAVDVWRAAELAATEDAWYERIARACRSGGTVS